MVAEVLFRNINSYPDEVSSECWHLVIAMSSNNWFGFRHNYLSLWSHVVDILYLHNLQVSFYLFFVCLAPVCAAVVLVVLRHCHCIFGINYPGFCAAMYLN